MSIKFAPRSHTAGPDAAVVIREASVSDRSALRSLAERDSARLPAEPLIVAVVGDEVRAAASVADGAVIADPFRHTAELAALAELRAAQLRAARRHPLRPLARSAGIAPHPLRGTA
jgi:hypothetical protein